MKPVFKEIHDINNLSSIKPDWITLHTMADNPSIYNSYEFIHNSLTYLKQNECQPYILLIYIESDLAGIFFIERNIERKSKIQLNVIESTAQHEIDKPYPIIHKSHSKSVWQAFFKYLAKTPNWDLCRFYELEEDKSKNIIHHLSNRRSIIRVNPDKSGPTINLNQSWDEYLMQHKKMRKKINRLINNNPQSITFNLYVDDPDALNIYKNIESKSWKKGKVGISKNLETLDFYQAMCHSIKDSQHLSVVIGVLSIDNTPISAEIAYTCNNNVYFCHGCYDEAYSKYSPGMISTAYFIQHFMEQDYLLGDFLCGYAHYLNAWSDNIVNTQQIDIYNNTLKVKAFFAIRAARKLLSYMWPSAHYE